MSPPLDKTLYRLDIERLVILLGETFPKEIHSINWQDRKIENSISVCFQMKLPLKMLIVPIGCSFLLLAAASFSSLWSRTPALCSRSESLDFACKALTSPFRFLAMCLRVFCNELGILDERVAAADLSR